MATSTGSPTAACHLPLLTTPNSPEPRDPVILESQTHNKLQYTLKVNYSILNMVSVDLSVFVMRQLLIETSDSGSWGPVDVRLFKILLLTLTATTLHM